MRWRRAAAAIGVVLATLVLAQGGCELRLNSPDRPPATEVAPSSVTSDADPDAAEALTPDTGDQANTMAPAAQPAIGPAPSMVTSPVAGGSPSVAPKPSRVAASASPSPATPAEVVAVSMTKDNRIAQVDASAGRITR